MNIEGDLGVLAEICERAVRLKTGGAKEALPRPWLLGPSGTARGVYFASQLVALSKRGLMQGFCGAHTVSVASPLFAYALTGHADWGLHICTHHAQHYLSQKLSDLKKGAALSVTYLEGLFRGAIAGMPFNQEAFQANGTAHKIAVTRADTGEGELLDGHRLTDVIAGLCASLAAPVFSHGRVQVGPHEYLDGEVGCPLPARAVFEQPNPPSSLLVLANGPRTRGDEDPGYSRIKPLYERLPLPVRRAIERQSLVFHDELAYLRERMHEHAEYGTGPKILIIWTGDEDSVGTTVGRLETDPTLLHLAGEEAGAHLGALLNAAMIEAQAAV